MDLTMHSVETLQRPHHPHRPTVWSFIQDHYSLILIPFTSASVTSERGVVCQEVKQLLLCKGNALTMDPAGTLTEFCRFHAAHSIADNAKKTDATLTLSGRRFVHPKAWWSWTKLRTAGQCCRCGQCGVSSDPLQCKDHLYFVSQHSDSTCKWHGKISTTSVI